MRTTSQASMPPNSSAALDHGSRFTRIEVMGSAASATAASRTARRPLRRRSSRKATA
ncbi:hypothetical protein [Nonomuraea recticatena]|uniref:hypothetical protein n=1 Tax=Nonomuraea recticatena TaxID=46178 RepID=UPI00361AA0DF